MKMEPNQSLGQMPLPGDRQGMSGADAGHDSMRTVGGRVLRRRTPAAQEATAQPHQREVESDHLAEDQAPLPAGSPIVRRTARRRAHTGRIKWSRELNSDVMRAFYYVNQCDDNPLPGWRHSLYAEFSRRHPELQVTEQNIADRKNVITRKGWLTRAELETIRREVGNIIHQDEIVPNDVQERTEQIAHLEETPQLQERHDGSHHNPALNRVREKFHSLLSYYEGSDPLNRPSLPKLRRIFKARQNISLTNEVLEDHLIAPQTLDEVHLSLYCAAVAVIELNGQKTYMPKSKGQTTKRESPAWKRRIEQDIDKLRGRADVIGVYLQNIRTRRIIRKTSAIASPAGIRLEDPQHHQKLVELKDRFRQQAKAKGARLRRYNELSKRKQQNADFIADRKKFFRDLESPPNNPGHVQASANTNEFRNYWSSIWSEAVHYNRESEWVADVEQSASEVEEMSVDRLSAEHISQAIRKTSNWKAPGPDKLHNFWIKNLPACFPSLARCFTEALDNPLKFPKFLTEGNTYMLYKKGDPAIPSNHRPITCLSVVYKLFTSLLNNRIYEHCATNNILEEEQKGCIRGSAGCKHQLSIDAVVIKQVQTRKRNLNVCYIDYRKAFDSVPHDWLIKVLEIYKICPKVRAVLQHFMSTWRTNILINNNNAGKVKISRGIFQGDSLSPVWFCLALNPLSTLLKNTNIRYRLNIKNGQRLSHLLYMDDMKLFAENQTGQVCHHKHKKGRSGNPRSLSQF